MMPSDILSHQPLIERYLKKTPTHLSPFAFANIFVWQDFFQFECEEIDDNLCIFAGDQAGTFLYLPPLGKTISEKAVAQCFKRMKGKVARIENVSEEQLDHFQSKEYKIYKKGYEYLYYRQDLLGLKGDAYKSKRNAYNHFLKNFSASFEPYKKSMAKECFKLYESWDQHKRATLKDVTDLALLDDNKAVHRRALESFEKLDLVGRVVKVDDEIVAYTFGYFVGTETFCDFLEIANYAYTGLSTFIFSQFCNDPALANAKFINVMDDFAMKSVNWTKMSFRPSVMLPTYTVSLR